MLFKGVLIGLELREFAPCVWYSSVDKKLGFSKNQSNKVLTSDL